MQGNETSDSSVPAFKPGPLPIIEDRGTDTTFVSHIPNCYILMIFPEIYYDPQYGLPSWETIHTHSWKSSKLQGLTPMDMAVKYREWGEGTLAPSKSLSIYPCEGVPESPYWNIVELKGTLRSLNSRPATYQINISVLAEGFEIPANITQTVTLQPGQAYPVRTLVPVRTMEASEIFGWVYDIKQVG